MLVGLALRALSGWLQDHIGIDVDHAGCSVEYLGSSRVIVRLQDVSLTEALWSFFVGPLLPFTTHSGRVQEVVVDISTEAFKVDVKGVALRLRKVTLPEVQKIASSSRARTLKDRDRLLSRPRRPSEIKGWVKGKLEVTVSDVAVVLHDDIGPNSCGPCSLAFLCKSVVLCDPESAAAATARADLLAQGDATQLPVLPVHASGRDQFYQMAKDIFLSEVSIHLTVGKPLPSDFGTDFGERGTWKKEDALLPLFSLCIAYRNWEPWALTELPDAAKQAKRTLLVQVCPLEAPPESVSIEGLGIQAARRQFVLSMDTQQFAFLASLLGNQDSLYFAWSTVLAESTRDISCKPSGKEVLRYVELWRQYRSVPAFSRPRELSDMEFRFAGSYTARMRNMAESDSNEQHGDRPGSFRCCSTSQEATVSLTESMQSGVKGGMDGEPTKSSLSTQLTPRISRELAEECFQDPGQRAASPLLVGVESNLGAKEFAVDSAYRILVPDLGFLLRCHHAYGGPSAGPASLLRQVSFRGTLRIHLPSFGVSIVKDLDNRHISVKSHRVGLDVAVPADTTADSFCRSEDSSWQIQRPLKPPARMALLDWKGLEFGMDYFGENSREMCIKGQVTMEFPTIWPVLQDFPGLRSTVDFPQVFHRWYPGELFPAGLEEMLSPVYVPRQSIYVLEIPSLQVKYMPAVKDLPHFLLSAAAIDGSVGPLDACALNLECVSLRCPAAGFASKEKSILELTDIEVVRNPLRGKQHPLGVKLPDMEVNLTPFVLHVAMQHWQSYDPRPLLRKRSAKPEPEAAADATVPSLPNLMVSGQKLALRLWEQGQACPAAVDQRCPELKPRVQICFRGVEVSSYGSSSANEVSAEARLQVAGLLGELISSSEEDVCEHGVFVCAHLDGAPLHDEGASPAISAAMHWTPEKTELSVPALYLHLAPTTELLQCIRMLVPGTLGGKSNIAALATLPPPKRADSRSSSFAMQLQATPEEEEVVHPAETARPQPSRGDDGQVGDLSTEAGSHGRAKALRIQGFCVGLHFGAWGQEPVLQRLPDATGRSTAGSAGAAGTVDSTYVGADGVAVSAWLDREVRTVEASTGCVHVSVVRKHYVVRDLLPALEHPEDDAISSGVELVWIAALESIAAVAVLPSAREAAGASSAAAGASSASSLQLPIQLGALHIRTASLWSTAVAGEAGGSASPRAGALKVHCPFVPQEHVDRHLCQLLSTRGPEPWLSLSLNGATVSQCEGPGSAMADGFYTIVPYLCGGSIVYKKIDGPFGLTCDEHGQWHILPDLPEPDGEVHGGTKPTTPESGWSRRQRAASPEVPKTPRAFTARLCQKTLVHVRLAPTALVVPRIDVSPLVRLPMQAKRFRQEASEPKPSADAASARSSATEARPRASVFQVPVFQLHVVAEVSLTLKDRPGCPLLRLRCTPRPKFTSGRSICELNQIALELVEDTRGGSASHAQVSLSLSHVHIFQPVSRGPGDPDIVLVINSIYGRQVQRERHTMFVRKFNMGKHVKLSFSPKKVLFLYVAPTAVRLHRDWMEPLARLLSGLIFLFRASKFTQPAGLSLDSNDSWNDATVLWEGPLWEITQDGSTFGVGDGKRCWVQVLADGSIKDLQSPTRPYLMVKGCTPRPSAPFGWRLRGVELGSSVSVEYAVDTARDAAVLKHIVPLIRAQDPLLFQPTLSSSAHLQGGNSKSRSEPPLNSENTSMSRFPSMLAVNATNATRQVAERMAQTMQRITNAAASNPTSPRGSAGVSREQSIEPEPGMRIEVEVRSLEFWLPTSRDEHDERELGVLLAADAHGVTGEDVVATMHKLVAMHVVPGCWHGDDDGTESLPESVDLEDDGAILESNFADITHWNPTEVASSGEPGSPMAAPARSLSPAPDASVGIPTRHTPLWEAVLGETVHRIGFVTPAWPPGKLMETSGLAIALLWDRQARAGVRLESVELRVPADLLHGWPVLKEHIAALRMEGIDVNPHELDSPVGGGHPHDQVPRSSHIEVDYKISQPTPTYKDTANRKCLPCHKVGKAVRTRFTNIMGRGSANSIASSWETPEVERKEEPAKVWKFEFDVLGQVEVILSGGLLAPAHWLEARFSDITFRGNLPLQESSPLNGVFRCEVACYDSRTAMLEPVLEPVEITVDVLRARARDEYSLHMARLNLNVHRVLVEFLESVRTKLRETEGMLLRPIGTFRLRNETGVLMCLQWPDSAYRIELKDEEHASINIPASAMDDRGVKLTFSAEAPLPLEDEVMIDLDYKHGRSYFMRASRCVVFVEPQHDVEEDGQCTCTLLVHSAVSIHNNTAIPMHITLTRPLGLGRGSLSSLLPTLRNESGPLVIQPHSTAKCVPLNWCTVRGGITHIKPAVGDIPPRSFSQLSNLLEGRLPNEVALDEPSARPTTSFERQVHERTKFNLFFPTYMKLIGYVNAYDVPMSELEDMLPSKRYEVHLENVVSFRNMLPFPVILQLCAISDVLEVQEFPAAHVHQAFHGTLDQSKTGDTSPTSPDLEASTQGLRCFSRCEPEGGLGKSSAAALERRTQLDNILQLTQGNARSKCVPVASYVLGVDQELKVPFAKRSLHFRILALAETSEGQAGREVPTSHPILASTAECMFLPPVRSDKIFISLWERSDGAPLARPSGCCSKLSTPDGELGGSRSLQVGLELTRNTVVLFAPVVIENLTPFPLHIHPEDSKSILAPYSRRVLPRSQQVRDAVYFALRDSAGTAKPAGQEIVCISSASTLERPAAVSVPSDAAPADCGIFVDSLSLALCVRTGAPPLRLTKVVSIVPRFFVRSELDAQVWIHFDGMSEIPGYLLNPHEKGVPLHPRGRNFGSEGQSMPPITSSTSMIQSFNTHPAQGLSRVYLTDTTRKSTAFAVEQWRKDYSENKRNFHVRMGTTSQQSAQPHFVQVDIHQAVFPGEDDHVLYADCYFIVLRTQDFRGSEDSLFHMENCTPFSFFTRFAEQRAVLIEPAGTDGHASHQWVHQVDSKDLNDLKDKDKRSPAALEICQDVQCKQMLQSVDLEKVAEFRPHAVVATFCLQARVQRWTAKEAVLGRVVVNGLVTFSSEVDGFSVVTELTFQSLGPPERARVYLVKVGRVSTPVPEDAELVRLVFQDCWYLRFIGTLVPEPNVDWRKQLLQTAGLGVELCLEVCVEVRHVEGADGVHHFSLKGASTQTLGAAPASSKSKGLVKVVCPVLSVSWVHDSYEVLAARLKGVQLQFTRESNDERNDDCGLEVSAQHMQVDHFLEGELPVVLNRRFLHINSRLLGKKAFFLKVNWVLGSRSIHLLRLDVVPYWLNLEIGVLIRLWDLAEGSFSSLLQRAVSKAEPLLEPQLPSSGEEQQAAIWRLTKLVVEPLKVTIMVRSPDPASVRDNPTARRILRLPTDMPNMDLFLPTIKEPNIRGTTRVLLGWLSHKYTRRVKYSALWSIFLSYLAAILKGLLNAIYWLARGPYDAIKVAQEAREEILRNDDQVHFPLISQALWWVSPMVHGLAEGTYRAMAELLGNSIFGVVLILNAIRQLILNTTRPRAQSILDGFVYGFRGLVLDTMFTPMQQLLLQTQIAFQDWGALTATLVFCLSLVRLPLGPFLGVTHFVASSCEGLVNILLHEEAQFAPFEPQRIIEGSPLRPSVDMREAIPPEEMPEATASLRKRGDEMQYRDLPKKWWLFPRLPRQLHMVSRAIGDDDEVMDNFSTVVLQHALRG